MAEDKIYIFVDYAAAFDIHKSTDPSQQQKEDIWNS